MLKLYHRLGDLDFEKLMDLYEEGNRENAEDLYPGEEPAVALRRAEQDFYEYLREDFFRVKGAVYGIWLQEGIYVSALRLEPYRDGLLLEALETHPSHRRKGHATALIQAVQAHLAQQGSVKLYSHVGKRNTASLGVHLACGFEKHLDHAVYVDGTVTQRSWTMLYQAGSESTEAAP